MMRLTAYGLRRALIAGCQRVIARRDELNRINVFPVRDHDAGTNLAYTVGSVLQCLRQPQPAAAGVVLQRVAHEITDSARGCSGVMLAQFFQGLAETLAASPRVTPAQLAAAVARGYALARATVAAPQAGTMLSVIQVLADGLGARAGTGDLRDGFAAALTRAQETLRQTRDLNPALRSAGVVDAGALGFVTLLEGIANYVERGRLARIGEIPADLVAAGVDITRSGDGPHRYCVECVLHAAHVDRAALKNALLVLPLSELVISGTREQVRLHAHVDEPAQFLALAARFGRVSLDRVEDMSLAVPPPGGRRPPVAIATDSGADIPLEEMARLGIHLVPQRLSIEGRDHIDRLSITTSEFYHVMRTSLVPPRTSQPAPGDFRRLFEFLLTHHASVVDVSLARALSGTLQSAESAATRGGVGRVHVFDTGSAATGQGLLTLWAAEAAQAGCEAGWILAGLARMRPRTKVYAVVRDIEYGVRGGRIPRGALTLMRLLHLTLTITLRPNGRLGLMGGLWGRKNIPERFARSVARRLDPVRRYRVIVGHCDCADDARRAHEELRASGRTIDRSWVVETGVAIGAHAGPGSLVIGVQDYEPPAP